MATRSLDEETQKKIIRQVEFYFSDSNIPRDGFLKKTIEESEDGLVSLALICSFARMRLHLGLGGEMKPEDVSEDTLKAVYETLKKASTFLKFSEDGKKVGRRTGLPKPEVVHQIDERTVAVSPLEHDVTREDLETFFTQYGKVNSVRLPKHVGDKKVFCGTGLVEFSSDEDAASVLKQSLSYAGTELELKPKKDYDVEREEMEVEFEKTRASRESKDNTNSEPDYPKGLIVSFKLKNISAGGSAEDTAIPETTDGGVPEGQKASENPEEAEKETSAMETDNDKHTGEVKSEEKSDEDGNKENVKKTTVGEGPGNDDEDVVTREDMKSTFGKFGTVKYVDYTRGAESGYIRFEDPEGAQKARAAAVLVEGGLVVKRNYTVSLEALTGDAEKDYWGLLRGSQVNKRQGDKGNYGRGGRNFRGGRRGNKAQRV